MEGQASELRDHNRFDYKHPLTCLIMGDIARLPEKAAFKATIMDISSSGLGIYAENDLTQGAVMLVRIPVAGTEANVPTLAAVQWSKPNCNGYHAGLKFVMG